MAFSRRRYVPNAIQLGPGNLPRIVGPNVVEPLGSVGASEPKNDQPRLGQDGAFLPTDKAYHSS